MRSILRRLRRDERGASALEFALLAPVLLTTYAGIVEAGQAVVAGRRTAHAASSLADLSALKGKLTDADMADTFAAASSMLKPMSTTKLALKVTSVTGDKDGNPKVDWSDAQGTGLSKDPVGGAFSGLPAGLITQEGETAIVATAKYTLIQASKIVILKDIDYSKSAYVRPRAGKVTRSAT